jgi:hypothetical protein
MVSARLFVPADKSWFIPVLSADFRFPDNARWKGLAIFSWKKAPGKFPEPFNPTFQASFRPERR